MADSMKARPVRARRVVERDGEHTTRLTVFCPERERSIHVDECLACRVCDGITFEADGRVSSMRCRSNTARESVPYTGKSVWSSPDQPARTEAGRVRISEVMSSNVICVRPDLTLDKATEILLDNDISGLPVVDEAGHAIGVISKTDLVRHGYLASRSPRANGEDHVEDVMCPIAFTLNENATLTHGAALMVHEGLHRVIVVDQDADVVGIVAALDILEWMAQAEGFAVARTDRIPHAK